tara:strand:- start:521 stop:850 length:330 start_codon:yes stop_codon:yes gene_type:complete
MAQNFRNQVTKDTGTSAAVILAQADSFDTVISVRCANVATTVINVDIYIIRSSTNYYLIKSAPISVGGSLELIDGGSKIVLANGDQIAAVSDTASSLDTVVSVIDTIST